MGGGRVQRAAHDRLGRQQADLLAVDQGPQSRGVHRARGDGVCRGLVERGIGVVQQHLAGAAELRDGFRVRHRCGAAQQGREAVVGLLAVHAEVFVRVHDPALQGVARSRKSADRATPASTARRPLGAASAVTLRPRLLYRGVPCRLAFQGSRQAAGQPIHRDRTPVVDGCQPLFMPQFVACGMQFHVARAVRVRRGTTASANAECTRFPVNVKPTGWRFSV